MWDVVVDEQRQERRQQQQQQGGGANGTSPQQQQQQQQQGGGATGTSPQQQQGGPSGTAPQAEAEESEVVVGSGLRCRRAGGVMTWVQSQQAGGAEAHGASVPDELAQNLDFVLVLGGAGLRSWGDVILSSAHRCASYQCPPRAAVAPHPPCCCCPDRP